MDEYSAYDEQDELAGLDAEVDAMLDDDDIHDDEPYGRAGPGEVSWFAAPGRRRVSVRRTEREVVALVNRLLGSR